MYKCSAEKWWNILKNYRINVWLKPKVWFYTLNLIRFFLLALRKKRNYLIGRMSVTLHECLELFLGRKKPYFTKLRAVYQYQIEFLNRGRKIKTATLYFSRTVPDSVLTRGARSLTAISGSHSRASLLPNLNMSLFWESWRVEWRNH